MDELLEKKIILAYERSKKYAQNNAYKYYYRDEIIDDFPSYVVIRILNNPTTKIFYRLWFVDFVREKFGRKSKTKYVNGKRDYFVGLVKGPTLETLDEMIGSNPVDIERYENIDYIKRKLPKFQAEIAISAFFHGSTKVEIAEKLNTTYAKVRYHLDEAIRKIKKKPRFIFLRRQM